MNDIGKKTYEHIRGLLYGKEQKEMTISAITMNYVFDYVDNLQSKIDKAIEYIEENGYNVSNNILLDILRKED